METPQTHRRMSRGPRIALIVLASLAVLIVVGRLVLDPIAAQQTRKALETIKGFKATFTDVHVTVLPPSYEITNFKLIEDKAGRWDEPLIFTESARVSILWRRLLDRQVVARAVVVGPKFVAIRRVEEKAKKAPRLGKTMQDAAPIKIDRLEIVDGEVLIAEGKGKNAPKLWLNKVNAEVANIAMREEMMDERPATLNLTGRVQRSGKLRVEATINPWTQKPTFTSDAALEGLDARELHGLLANKADLKATRGEINLFVKVKAKNGVLDGGVKPIIKDLELEAQDQDIGTKVKAFLADAAVELMSDDIPGRDAIATTIPIKGTLDQPDTQIVPTILGVVRNAFVVGLQAGFTNLPPKTAPKEEGVVRQAVDALKSDEGPPEAQPGEADQQKRTDARTRQGRKGKATRQPD